MLFLLEKKIFLVVFIIILFSWGKKGKRGFKIMLSFFAIIAKKKKKFIALEINK